MKVLQLFLTEIFKDFFLCNKFPRRLQCAYKQTGEKGWGKDLKEVSVTKLAMVYHTPVKTVWIYWTSMHPAHVYHCSNGHVWGQTYYIWEKKQKERPELVSSMLHFGVSHLMCSGSKKKIEESSWACNKRQPGDEMCTSTWWEQGWLLEMVNHLKRQKQIVIQFETFLNWQRKQWKMSTFMPFFLINYYSNQIVTQNFKLNFQGNTN